MNPKHIIEKRLVQHTPILHFQHSNDLAILRTSELKPKLDEYLIKRNKGWENVPENWKNAGEHHSLKFKVSIKVTPRRTNASESRYVFGSYFNSQAKNTITNSGSIPIAPTPYFADAEKVRLHRMEECKVGLYYNPGDFEITLSVVCFIPKLLEFINEYIDKFFALNNFGTRQSKGFGSFGIENSEAVSNTPFWFTVPLGRSVTDPTRIFENLFGELDLFWKSMRGGVNDSFRGEKGFYFKPMIFRYAKEARKFTWDKKAIKNVFFNSILREQIVKWKKKSSDLDVLTYQNEEERLMRDMLGLSNQQTWRISDREEYSITKENATVERFKSPITLKPIYFPRENVYRVYLIRGTTPDELQGKEFIIKCSGRQETLPLRFPNSHEAGITDFLNYCFGTYHGEQRFDINNIKVNTPNDPKFKTLKRIFSEIRQNLNS